MAITPNAPPIQIPALPPALRRPLSSCVGSVDVGSLAAAVVDGELEFEGDEAVGEGEEIAALCT